MTLLVVLLLGTMLPALAAIYWVRRSPISQERNARNEIVLLWFYFLAIVIVTRLVAGLLILSGSYLPAATYFYPIRIAGPNWQLLEGLPYLILCLLALFYLPQIAVYIRDKHLAHLLLWVFSAGLLLSFGAIHGGPVAGNIGISDSAEHLSDARLNATVWDVFATHTDRIMGRVSPPYRAPHSTSHPATSVVYWHLAARAISPLVFSLINVLLFAAVFPVIYWCLSRRFDNETAMQATLGCLVIPGLLIYGRSDDAVLYGLAGSAMALSLVAVSERRYELTAGAGLMAALGLNKSYAAIILLPAMSSFIAAVPLKKIWQHTYRIAPHVLIVLAIISLVVYSMWLATSFDLLKSFQVSVDYNRPTHILSVLRRGDYAAALSDRLMAWGDFLIFSGPLLLYLIVTLVRRWTPSPPSWQLRNVALTVLLCVLAVNSSGAGELARPWGSVYLLIAICWLPEFLQNHDRATRWWLIRTQFGWAIFLQTILNFVW